MGERSWQERDIEDGIVLGFLWLLRHLEEVVWEDRSKNSVYRQGSS